jgi:transposase
MDTARDALPDDITALKEALATERVKALDIAAELAVARAKASEDSALIAQQKLRIAKLERQIYGQRSERSSRLVDQLALTFEELEADATEDELAAEQAVARTTTVRGFTRTRPERNTFPEHLPRERVVIDPPMACECCGGNRLRKLGEDVTRTLESVPRQWKVVETVREKFSCRDCEKISQAPAPFHAVARGWAGPSLLAMIMFEKFGQHQPLNRQATNGMQQNACRDLICAHIDNTTLPNGRVIAERLQVNTDRRAGLGLLFLITGKEGREYKIVISRFPTDSAILVEENPKSLDVEFLERVFMKNKTSYKAVLYRHSSLRAGFWEGKAIDKQTNPTGESADYWIADFLLSDFSVTPKQGTVSRQRFETPQKTRTSL